MQLYNYNTNMLILVQQNLNSKRKDTHISRFVFIPVKLLYDYIEEKNINIQYIYSYLYLVRKQKGNKEIYIILLSCKLFL